MPTEAFEQDLLLRCVRAAIGTEVDERLGDAATTAAIDWSRLVHTAARHGVMPLLHATLRTTCRQAVPAPVLDALHADHRRHVHRSLVLTGELLDVLAAFEAHGVPAIPIKGPVLAAALYGDVTRRQYADLDVLVRPADATRAADLLTARGYALGPPAEWAFPAHRSVRGVRVTLDLQWEVAEARHRSPVSPGELWARLQPLSIGGATVQQPAPEDQLLLLCSHPAKHSWSRLGWIADIAAFAQVHASTLDWGYALARARRARGERMVLLGLRLAADLLHADVPAPVRLRMREDAAVTALAYELRERLFAPWGSRARLNGSYGPVEAALLYMRSRERAGDRAAHAVALLRQLLRPCRFTPNERDRAVVALPQSLAFGYYAIRPLRVTQQYGRTLVSALVALAACRRPVAGPSARKTTRSS